MRKQLHRDLPMPASAHKRIVFVSAILTHYRQSFHEQVRARLARHDVHYDVVYSNPFGAEAKKGDTIDIDWAHCISARAFGRGKRILLQLPLRQIKGASLVIIGQENRLLLNYLLQMTPSFLRPKVAFWGHGRNFQSRNPDGRAERWKRFWATKVDWWFAYTNETRRHVEALGFPSTQITVFNNAVDTDEVSGLAATITPQRLAMRRAELGIEGKNVGVFVGGLYPDKRLAFLVDAAERIRLQVPDFTLIVVGGGEQTSLMRDLATARPWIKMLGARFGADKVELMLLGRLFLMPGLVGLGVVDAGAAGLPTVTTAFPYHSPEIAYVEHDVNGVIVPQWDDPQKYADAVTELLRSPDRLALMSTAAVRMAQALTIEAMADRFTFGVLAALAR
jgi:glycosyltransferase involved in cell wall biosynthesis